MEAHTTKICFFNPHQMSLEDWRNRFRNRCLFCQSRLMLDKYRWVGGVGCRTSSRTVRVKISSVLSCLLDKSSLLHNRTMFIPIDYRYNTHTKLWDRVGNSQLPGRYPLFEPRVIVAFPSQLFLQFCHGGQNVDSGALFVEDQTETQRLYRFRKPGFTSFISSS